jgi:1-acyl-sn-glycerol-3-phosphate acyltransferase
LIIVLRSIAFYIGYALATLLWGSFGALFGWLIPYRSRFRFVIGGWTRFCLWWLKVTCGINCRVRGLERLPKDPCIVLCRHESTWETLFLQTVFAPQATLIKRELLWIPFFGWAFRGLRPIAIDRGDGRKALRQLIHEGKDRLAKGIWVVLFPEGTRLQAGERGRFLPGGAALGAASGHPIILVAHNAGSFWPAHAFRKFPGTIDAVISTRIDTTGLSSKDLQRQVTERFEALMAELPTRRG